MPTDPIVPRRRVERDDPTVARRRVERICDELFATVDDAATDDDVARHPAGHDPKTRRSLPRNCAPQ